MFCAKVMAFSVLIFNVEGHKIEKREPLSYDQLSASLHGWRKENDEKFASLETKIQELSRINGNLKRSYDQFSSAVSVRTTENKAEVAELKANIRHLINMNNDLKQTMRRGQTPPVGFIYIQYGRQSSPSALWPSASWSDVSSQYAGAFFRAVGGHSEPFGQNQRESMRTLSFEFLDTSSDLRSTDNLPYDSSAVVTSGGRYGPWNRLHVYYNQSEKSYESRYKDNEVRPFNQAVLIWKRTA